MSLWSAYRNLSFRSKLGVGVGLLAWGAVGPYLADRAEERFGFTPTPEEKAALDSMAPKLHVVDKEERR